MILWKIILSFLAGSIPFAKVAMMGTGIDITKAGSKNPGFNNVWRVSRSKRRAAIVLLGDIVKGYLPLLLLSDGESASRLWIIGIAAVLGHCWSPFLKFNGGKGVSTTVGVLLYLEFLISISCLPLYPLLRMFGRRMKWKQEGAISSLITMFVISTVVMVTRGLDSGVFAYILFVIVFFRHMSNLREIMGLKP